MSVRVAELLTLGDTLSTVSKWGVPAMNVTGYFCCTYFMNIVQGYPCIFC